MELPRVHEEQLRAATERTHGILAQARAAHLGGRVETATCAFLPAGGFLPKDSYEKAVDDLEKDVNTSSSFALGFAAVVEEARRRPELVVRCLERYPVSESERRSLARVLMYRVLSPLSTDSSRLTSELLKYAGDRGSPQCFEQLIKAYSGRSDLVSYFNSVWSVDIIRDAITTACTDTTHTGTKVCDSLSGRIFTAAISAARHLLRNLRAHKALTNFPPAAAALCLEPIIQTPGAVFGKYILLPALKRCLRLAHSRRLGKRRLADDLGRDFCLTADEASARGDHIGLVVVNRRQDEDASDDDLDLDSDDENDDNQHDGPEAAAASSMEWTSVTLEDEDEYAFDDAAFCDSEAFYALVWQRVSLIFRCSYDPALAQRIISKSLQGDDRRRVRGYLDDLTKSFQDLTRALAKYNDASSSSATSYALEKRQFNIVPKARALCGCFCASRAECTLLASALLAVEAAIYLPRSHMAALKEAAEFSVDEDRNCVVALRAPGGLFFNGEDEDRDKKDEAYERHANAIEPAWRDARRARALARRYLRRVVVECEEEEVDSFSYSKRSKRRRVPQGEFAGISPPSPETHRRREARKESQRALKRREPYRYSEQGSDDWHGHDLDDDDDENQEHGRVPRYSGSSRASRGRKLERNTDQDFDDNHSYFSQNSDSRRAQASPASEGSGDNNKRRARRRSFDKVRTNRIESTDDDGPTALPSTDQQLTNSTGSVKADDDDRASCISAATSRTGPTIIIQNSTVVIKKEDEVLKGSTGEDTAMSKDTDPTAFFSNLLEKVDGDTVTINGGNFVFRSDGRDLSFVGQTAEAGSAANLPQVSSHKSLIDLVNASTTTTPKQHQDTEKPQINTSPQESRKDDIPQPPRIMISPPPAQTPERPVCIGGTSSVEEERKKPSHIERAVSMRQQELGFVDRDNLYDKVTTSNASLHRSRSPQPYQRPPTHPRPPSFSQPNSMSSHNSSNSLSREVATTPGAPTRPSARSATSSPTPSPRRSRSTPPSSRNPPARPPHPHKRSASPAPSDEGSSASRRSNMKTRSNSEANLQRQLSYSNELGTRAFSFAPDSEASPMPRKSPFTLQNSGGDEVAGLAMLSPPGLRLIKYCRSARPHGSLLSVDECGGTLSWTSRKKGGSVGSISIHDVEDIQLGAKTPVFARYAAKDKADYYFSVITKFRSLDFECPNKAVRDNLVAAIDFLYKHNDL